MIACGRRTADAGFSLVEVMVSLLIFALIGAAGFSVLDQILRTQRQTDGRLERLAEIQRAMYLIETDFMQADAGSLTFEGGGVAIRRSAPSSQAGSVALRYALQDGVLTRSLVSGTGGAAVQQPILSGVRQADWAFFTRRNGWTADWPQAAAPGLAGTQQAIGAAGPGVPGNPQAVSLTVGLSGPGLSGTLRRIALLPDDPR